MSVTNKRNKAGIKEVTIDGVPVSTNGSDAAGDQAEGAERIKPDPDLRDDSEDADPARTFK